MKFYTDNSFRHMLACSGGQVSFEYPEKLFLDITQDCNLYCQMCRDKLEIAGKTMPFDLFCRLIDETAPYVKSYSLFNWGEPLIVNDFRERVDYVNSVKRNDCIVDISTNGIMLSDDMIKFLHSMNVKISVSFDGADKNTFESIRRGAKFDRICENLARIAKVYSETPVIIAPGIYTTIQRDNQDQLFQIAKLAHSFGVKRMGYGILTSPKEFTPITDDSLRHEIERTSEYIDKNDMLNDLYPTKIGDYLWHGSRYVHKNEFIVDTNCNAPFVSASIAYNGDVFLCCNVGEFVDNVKDKSFKEIWNSDKYNRLRESVNLTTSMPNKCKHCAWFNR